MPFLELFDETLDINSTENYDLAVQISYDGLSFSLLDTIRNKFVLLRSFSPDENKYFNSDRLRELLTSDDFLLRKYKKVSLVVPSPAITIVPAPLYDPGKKEDYFTFNHIRIDGSVIVANKLNDPDAYLVFSEDKYISDLLNNFYQGIHPWHHLKPLFDHISHSRKTVNGNYIHIHVERDYFNLIIFNNNLLKFCNTYTYRNITDILYFVLNAFKKMDINQEETIFFSGLTEKFDDLSSNFSIYVRNIRFAVPIGNFTFSYVFNDTDLHRFLNLYSAVNCE